MAFVLIVDDEPSIRKTIQLCLEIAGENYYLIATRSVIDNGLDFMVTVPHENRPVGMARRETAERICAACSELSRRI